MCANENNCAGENRREGKTDDLKQERHHVMREKRTISKCALLVQVGFSCSTDVPAQRFDARQTSFEQEPPIRRFLRCAGATWTCPHWCFEGDALQLLSSGRRMSRRDGRCRETNSGRLYHGESADVKRRFRSGIGWSCTFSGYPEDNRRGRLSGSPGGTGHSNASVHPALKPMRS
jgi:hypothetical protein